MHDMHKQADHKAVPNRLAELLSPPGEPRVRMAKLAAHCDVDQSTVYRWRERLGPIPDDQKENIAVFFGITVADLMCWDRTPEAAA